MKPRIQQCSRCHRLSSVWGVPPEPYVCLLCKSDIAVQRMSIRRDNQLWGRDASKRLAEDLSVQLEEAEDGASVREVGGKPEFTSWIRMYKRLYQRKRNEILRKGKGGE
jgi:hypothetical protein